ncbi:hypothetical protein ACUOFC_23240, partial [Escherichia sp. TWPC-MK]
MYQPDFPPVPFRSGLYPVVDSVQWIERLLDAGVRTLQLRIKDRRDEEVEADVVAAIALGQPPVIVDKQSRVIAAAQ